jgi:hypothetical protein
MGTGQAGKAASMRILRRLVPELGALTVARYAWAHRGTLVRVLDLATDLPRLVREDGTGGIVRRGRLVYELDRAMPTETGVRISGVDAGAVTLAGDPGPQALERATRALSRVQGIVDIRADGTNHPALTLS